MKLLNKKGLKTLFSKKILALICLLIIASSVLLIAGCKGEQLETQPAEQQTQPAEQVEEETPPQVPFIDEEDLIDMPETARTEAPDTLLTALRCVDNKIEGTVTNVLDEQMDLSDAKIFINGLLKRNPECDKTILAPGESTFCDNFVGRVSLKDQGNKLLFRIYGLQTVDVIDCK